MRIGRLRHRITLQRRQATGDSGGGESESWTDVDTVWAEMIPLSGEEDVEAGRERAALRWRGRIRHRADVDPETMRVLYGSRTIELTAAFDPEGRGRELHLMGEEVPA